MEDVLDTLEDLTFEDFEDEYWDWIFDINNGFFYEDPEDIA